MSVTYHLNIFNNGHAITVNDATLTHLQEVDQYTFTNFDNRNEILSRYKIKEYPTSKTYVYVSYNYNGTEHRSYDVVYKEDSLIFNTRELLKQLNLYASPRDKDNITFIRYVAERFRSFEEYKNVCNSILGKINSDFSNEYFLFLRKAFEDTNKNYRIIRELYFLKKWFEQVKSYSNTDQTDENDVKYHQINMTEYLEQSKKR